MAIKTEAKKKITEKLITMTEAEFAEYTTKAFARKALTRISQARKHILDEIKSHENDIVDLRKELNFIAEKPIEFANALETIERHED